MALAKYAYVCEPTVTGVLAVYLAEKASFPTVVSYTSGEISTFTAAATGFKEVGFKIDSAEFESDTPEFENTPMVTNKITIMLSGPSALLNTFLTALQAAIPCGVQMIFTIGNGKSFLVGHSSSEGNKRPMSKMSKKYVSGAKPGESGKGTYQITISGTSSYDIEPFNTTIGGTITAGTALFIDYN